MRILFIASRFPYPALRGDQVRAYHFLRLLNLRHEVTLVMPIPHSLDGRAQQEIARLCRRWIGIPFRRGQALKNLGRFPFSSLPLQALYFCPPTFSDAVRRLVREEVFDLIHVQLARMAPAVPDIGHVPKVLDFIDALSLNMRRRAELERWPLSRLFRWEGERMSRYERELVSSFARQIISSPVDKAAIGEFETLHVVPNGVNIEDFSYNEHGRESKFIVFTGRMGYFPNAEAATYFATRVFPAVRREEPEARFLVVGADPPPKVQRLARMPGIEVTGYVPRIQDYLARATVAVAPMQAGTGIQNKVLEAMACGAPVVATPYALGGIEAADGEHLLVADNAKEFAEKVVRLLKDPVLRLQLARNARRLVEEKYTWERCVEMLEHVYRLAVQHK